MSLDLDFVPVLWQKVHIVVAPRVLVDRRPPLLECPDTLELLVDQAGQARAVVAISWANHLFTVKLIFIANLKLIF